MYYSSMSLASRTDEAFRALADPTRRPVLELLLDGERNVNDLAARFPMTQPAMSHHLRVLRRAGLVVHRRSGRERIYPVRPNALRPVADWIGQHERFWKRKLGRLGTF